jgi:uncharacterized protein (TIGR00255 family)
MTGFGRATLQEPDWSICWEVRSVNSRHLDLKWRTPYLARGLETGWEKLVRGRATRGRLELFLSLSILKPELLGASFNEPLAVHMLSQLTRFAKEHDCAVAPELNDLFLVPQLWTDELREPDPGLAARLEETLLKALDSWRESRTIEGRHLAEDLLMRYARLETGWAAIKEIVPLVREEKFAGLRARIQLVLDKHSIAMDPDRVLQEVAMLSDRLDVSEELTRLRGHLDRLAELTRNGGEAGKALDFTLQECFREINTCGNKAQDSRLSRLVVDFKVELEKCREQVQNLE